MAKLTAGERKEIPSSEFGLPKERAYPMPDRAHAANAKARAAQFATPAEKKTIDAKADRILHHGSGAHEAIPGGKQKLGRHHAEHGFVRHSKQGY